MIEVDYPIFLKTANSGDLLIYHLDETIVEPEDHPEDLYHYALIVKHLYKQWNFQIFFYDWVVCQYKLCSFPEFYREITEKGFSKLMYRKVCILRDEEYFDRQKEFFNCDPEIQMNTIKVQSTQYFKRLQMHAYMEKVKWYWIDMVETYYKCMKILPQGKFFKAKDEMNKKETKVTCSVPMKITNIPI